MKVEKYISKTHMDERDRSDVSLIRRSDDLDGRDVIGAGSVRTTSYVVTFQTDVELQTLGELGSLREEFTCV